MSANQKNSPVAPRASRRVALLAAVALLSVGFAGGCAGKKDPNAELRAKTTQQASALRAERDKLQHRAHELDRKAEQDRHVARLLWRDGESNVMAGEARIEQWDLERGQKLVERGEARMASADRKMELADQMQDDAAALRKRAEQLDQRAEQMIASLPQD